MFISANSVPMSSSPSSMSASVKLEQVSSNSVLVPNLSPVTLYTFRIRSENDLGKSDFSNEVTVTTTIEGLSSSRTFFHLIISCVQFFLSLHSAANHGGKCNDPSDGFKINKSIMDIVTVVRTCVH